MERKKKNNAIFTLHGGEASLFNNSLRKSRSDTSGERSLNCTCDTMNKTNKHAIDCK